MPNARLNLIVTASAGGAPRPVPPPANSCRTRNPPPRPAQPVARARRRPADGGAARAVHAHPGADRRSHLPTRNRRPRSSNGRRGCRLRPRARRRARAEGVPVERELLLYALHGMLHLAGFDDRTDRDFAAMHRTEDDILTRIGVGAVFSPPGVRSGQQKHAPGRRAGKRGVSAAPPDDLPSGVHPVRNAPPQVGPDPREVRRVRSVTRPAARDGVGGRSPLNACVSDRCVHCPLGRRVAHLFHAHVLPAGVVAGPPGGLSPAPRAEKWVEPTTEHQPDLVFVTAVFRLLCNTSIVLTSLWSAERVSRTPRPPATAWRPGWPRS